MLVVSRKRLFTEVDEFFLVFWSAHSFLESLGGKVNVDQQCKANLPCQCLW